MDSWTIGSLLQTATRYLHEKGSTSSRLDAEILLAEALGVERIELYTQYDRPLLSSEVDRYRVLVARRARREPVAYILGRSYFRHLTLEVTPAVLIPRPETEELVDLALETLRRRPIWEAVEQEEAVGPVGPDTGVSGAAPAFIADVGTGSGAIALSLAQESGQRILATDLSSDALTVAVHNRTALGFDDLVELRHADLLSGVADTSLRLVVSNPPYVSSAEMMSLVPDVRLFEPHEALDAGPEGLDVLRRLLVDAARVLMPGGGLIVEVGHTQARAVSDLAVAAGFTAVTVHKDLSGKERMVSGTLPGAPVRDASAVRGAVLDALTGALRAGAIVGLPTDTVYGLAAQWDCRAGVRRLFTAKGRDDTRPVAVVFSSTWAVKEALPDLDNRAEIVLEALLPGPFTFVVSTAVARPDLVGTADSLGVRVPDHPALLGILARLGTGLAMTSANPAGEEAPTSLAEVDEALLAHCSLALTASGFGCTEEVLGRPSTVVDLRPLSQGGSPVVLREGAVEAGEVVRRIKALQGC
ncbi:MAG: peptide chain release factor N(5)-glutamine methyltransferase [Thermoleophilia bacterium]|jgi:release factor glutamine methyltransferase